MGNPSLELCALKRIPKRYTADPNKIWDAVPQELEQVYARDFKLEDPWHVALATRDFYCSMDELKAHLAATRPELDFGGSWSMSAGPGGTGISFVDSAGVHGTMGADEYESVKTWHENRRIYRLPESSWCIDLYYGQDAWIAPALPCYVDKQVIMRLAAARIAHARKSDAQALVDRISETGYGAMCPEPDLIGALIDGMEYARRGRLKLRAAIVT